MRIAFAEFDGLTALDFVGFHDLVARPKAMGSRTDATAAGVGPALNPGARLCARLTDPEARNAIAAQMARDGQVT